MIDSRSWKSITDEMPPDHTPVLVCCMEPEDGAGPWVGAGFHVSQGWQSQDSIMLDLPLAFPVTHWMPMPSPPNAPVHRAGEAGSGATHCWADSTVKPNTTKQEDQP